MILFYQQYKIVDDIAIKVIASGTGHAIVNAKRCDADIILVHDKTSEESICEKWVWFI